MESVGWGKVSYGSASPGAIRQDGDFQCRVKFYSVMSIILSFKLNLLATDLKPRTEATAIH